jgi:hypothetical protein
LIRIAEVAEENEEDKEVMFQVCHLTKVVGDMTSIVNLKFSKPFVL